MSDLGGPTLMAPSTPRPKMSARFAKLRGLATAGPVERPLWLTRDELADCRERHRSDLVLL